MGTPNLTCDKGCGKPYERAGKWKKKHEADCDGTPYTPTAAAKKKVVAAPSAVQRSIIDLERNRAEVTRNIETTKGSLEILEKHAKILDDAIAELKVAQPA